MNPIFVIGAAAAAGVAVWRRKTFKSDAEKVAEVAKDATATATARVTGGGRKSKVRELGEAVYADRTDADTDNSADIDRLVSEIEEIDIQAAAGDDDAGESDSSPG